MIRKLQRARRAGRVISLTPTTRCPQTPGVQVEIRYTATTTGGATLLINGQTQPGWAVSGNYTRTNNLQRLLL